MRKCTWPRRAGLIMISRFNFDYPRLVGMRGGPLSLQTLQRHTGSIKTREVHILVSSGASREAMGKALRRHSGDK